jgi:hypothetical protein
LSYFLRAQKEKEIVKRKKLIDSSLGCYELAEKMYRRSSIAKTQLLFNLQNQAVALAELGEDLPAQELNTAVNTRIEVENAFRQVFHWISIDAP